MWPDKWVAKKGIVLVQRGKLLHEERGAVNLQGIMLMGIGFVFIGVGFIVFQIFMQAASDLLGWTYSPCEAIITADTYTGFTDIVGITPLLVLVGFMAAGVFAMYLGVQISKGSGSTKMDLGVLILLSLAIIFLAVALIFMPTCLDAISGQVAHGATMTFLGGADSANTTPVGTCANITLLVQLLCCDISAVTSVSTNVSGDAPVTITSYNCTSNELLVCSLTANQSRTANVTYLYMDNNASFTGVHDFLLMSPLLLIVSLIGGAIVVGFFGLKRLGSG